MQLTHLQFRDVIVDAKLPRLTVLSAAEGVLPIAMGHLVSQNTANALPRPILDRTLHLQRNSWMSLRKRDEQRRDVLCVNLIADVQIVHCARVVSRCRVKALL